MRCYRTQARITQNNFLKTARRRVAVECRLNICFEQFPDFGQLAQHISGNFFGHNGAAIAITVFKSALMTQRSFNLLGESALNLRNNIADDITDIRAGYVLRSGVAGENNLSQ